MRYIYIFIHSRVVTLPAHRIPQDEDNLRSVSISHSHYPSTGFFEIGNNLVVPIQVSSHYLSIL